METSTLRILLTATAIAAGATVAAAQERGPAGERMTFETLDVDGSGEITTEDLEQLRSERFAEFDTDGDGSVTAAEFSAHAEERARARAAEMFSRLDADGDGVLSRDVLEARMGRMPGERMLSRFDADGSGGVSEEEFEQTRQRMADRRGGHRGRFERGGGHGWGQDNH